MHARTARAPVVRIALAVGDRVTFAEQRSPYRVRAVSECGRWVICTKPFNFRHTVLYTIIDFDSGVRGPDDMVFPSGYETDAEVAVNLSRLEAGELEVSYRRDVPLNIVKVRPPAKTVR